MAPKVDMDSDHIPIRLDLPFPRLELIHEVFPPGKRPYGHYAACWHYRLVLRHLEDWAYKLDIGQTFTSDTQSTRYGSISQPFRMGVQIRFDARFLNMPAYIMAENLTEQPEPAGDAWYADMISRPVRLPEPESEEDDE
jgi:hypothetical protein